jgi:hypothetical protein
MNEKNEQFDEDLSLKVSPEFKKDLSNLFKSRHLISPEVDRAILDRASIKLIRRQRQRRIIRRIATIAAAAAVLVIAFSLDSSKKPQTQMPATLGVSKNYDFDQNGRVDILDAFKLAKQIQSANLPESNLSRRKASLSGLRKQGWDLNGDGLVDRSDVDIVAMAAVSLPRPKASLSGLQKQGPG